LRRGDVAAERVAPRLLGAASVPAGTGVDLPGSLLQLPPFFEKFGDEILEEFNSAEVRATLLDRLLDEQSGLPVGCRVELTDAGEERLGIDRL
jgi:hypothetical protein